MTNIFSFFGLENNITDATSFQKSLHLLNQETFLYSTLIRAIN